MAVHSLQVFADYFQFSVQDEAADADRSQADMDEANRQMLDCAPGQLRVITVRNVEVPVEVEVRADEPQDDLSAWDHVADASLEVGSGRLVVVGPTDYYPDAKRLPVEPGSYRARVFYRGLGTVSEDGLEGGDSYRVVLWPGPPRPVGVVKRWPGPAGS